MGSGCGLRLINGAPVGEAGAIANMRVLHGGLAMFLAKQFLDSADIISVFQQMRSKTVAKRVEVGHFLIGSRSSPRFTSGSTPSRLRRRTRRQSAAATGKPGRKALKGRSCSANVQLTAKGKYLWKRPL